MKAFKYLFGIGAAIILLGTAIFLIVTYWDRILSTVSAGARVATNILNQFGESKIDAGDTSDYYDL